MQFNRVPKRDVVDRDDFIVLRKWDYIFNDTRFNDVFEVEVARDPYPDFLCLECFSLIDPVDDDTDVLSLSDCGWKARNLDELVFSLARYFLVLL